MVTDSRYFCFPYGCFFFIGIIFTLVQIAFVFFLFNCNKNYDISCRKKKCQIAHVCRIMQVGCIWLKKHIDDWRFHTRAQLQSRTIVLAAWKFHVLFLSVIIEAKKRVWLACVDADMSLALCQNYTIHRYHYFQKTIFEHVFFLCLIIPVRVPLMFDLTMSWRAVATRGRRYNRW